MDEVQEKPLAGAGADGQEKIYTVGISDTRKIPSGKLTCNRIGEV